MKQVKPIGILTLSASDNCGSLLQTYALKTLIESIYTGTVEIVPFASPKSHLLYDIFPKGIWKKPTKFIKRMVHYKKLRQKKQSYRNFRLQYLRMPEKEIFPSQVNEVSDSYIMLVVGSDQVWNVRMFDFDMCFFGHDFRCPKIAYAPSLGRHSLTESDLYSRIVESLSKFVTLSSREMAGKKDLEEATARNVKFVLDPTLVLDLKEWEKLIGEPLVDEPYIFYYSWAYNIDSLNDIVKREGKRIDCPVYVIDANKWIDINIHKWDFKLFKESGPIVFLNLMFYSQKNFVESFHGMIFAYLFHTNFWLLDVHDCIEEIDTRLLELMRLLRMEDRLLTSKNLKEKDLNSRPEYRRNDKLIEMQRNSYNYLKDSLEIALSNSNNMSL